MAINMTPDTFTSFVIGLAGVGVAGFVAWTIAMMIRSRSELASFKLHVSETYLKKDDISELKEDIKQFSRVLYEIAGKLNIPTRKE